jgi:hypothetical protein
MRRFLILAAVMLATAACSPPQAGDTVQNNARNNAPPALTVPTPPPNAFYVGTWAHSEADCANAAWTIHPTSLQAPSGACKSTKITPTQPGFTIEAECIWREQTTKNTIQAAYAQSAKALLLSGTPDGDVGLVACSANSQNP